MAKEEKAAIAMAAFILLVVVVCLLERADHERVDLRYEIRVTIRLATDPNVES